MRPKTYTLAKAIQERKEILFGSGDAKSQHSVKEKEEAWESVRVYMIMNGFPNFEKKSWRDVRNHDWQYLRRSAAAKFEHNQKAVNDPVQYSEVDKIVFDIMGNDKTFDDCEYSEFTSNSNIEDNGSHSSPSSLYIDPKFGLNLSVNTINSNESDGGTVSFPSMEQTQTNSLMKTDALQPSEKADSVPANDSRGGASNNTDTNGGLLTAFPPTAILGGDPARTPFTGLDLINNLSSIIERNTVSPCTQTNKRKRLQTVEEDLQDAKLQLLLVQLKREEALLQQDQARVLQEYAKARQEHARAELLEFELAEKKKKRS